MLGPFWSPYSIYPKPSHRQPGGFTPPYADNALIFDKFLKPNVFANYMHYLLNNSILKHNNGLLIFKVFLSCEKDNMSI